jgi:hypothetical protein
MALLGIFWGAVFVVILLIAITGGQHRSREILKGYRKAPPLPLPNIELK